MSTTRKEGKDVIVFATAEDLKGPSNVELQNEKPFEGPILENGELNYDCPCVENMLNSPCGPEFKKAFLCIQNSKSDPKGMECVSTFDEMMLCMAEYPQIYRSNHNVDDDVDLELSDAEKALISVDSVKEESESVNAGSLSKVEGKPADKKSTAPTEKKSPPKSSTPATGALNVNV